MKKLSFFALAVAGWLLTACSEKDVIVESGTPETPQSGALSDGYLALNISLPTSSSSTRAANDKFDDGLPEEYKVTDCALLFFDEGDESGEEKAKLIYATTVTLSKAPDVDNDNITTSYKVVTGISGHTAGKQLYALAALNYQNVMSISDGKVTLAGQSSEMETFSELRNATSTADLTKSTGITTGDTDYFFMTNAVLSTTKGGDVDPNSSTQPEGVTPKVFQLAELDEDNIKTSETEAQNNPAGEILVERAVAKATLSLSNDIKVGTTEIGTNTGAKITGVEWVIDNMEPSTYIARNSGGDDYISYYSPGVSSDKYRFVSGKTTKDNTSLGTSKDYYRTYWCIDPHYDSDAYTGSTTEMKTYSQSPIASGKEFSAMGEEHPLYCYENTFDVAHQTYGNTTRAILKVTVEVDGESEDKDVYTYDGKAYTKTALDSHIMKFVVEHEMLANILDSYLKTGQSYDYATNLGKYLDYTLAADENGKCSVTTLTLNTQKDNFTSETSEIFNEGVVDALNAVLDSFKESLNELYVINKYSGGVMYYEARFTHFGDELTPWNTKNTWEDPAPKAGLSVADAYPGSEDSDKASDSYVRAANRYLGRFGMVRNNWYDVEVTSFLNFGSPVDPSGSIEKPGTPDDHLENNIAVRIHVLSWAKRKQSWSF